MEQVNIIGLDLAKRTFQLHGARGGGSVALSREKVLTFLSRSFSAVLSNLASASAHPLRPPPRNRGGLSYRRPSNSPPPKQW